MSDRKDVVYRVVATQKGRTGKLAAIISLSFLSTFALGLIVGQWNANAVILKSIELTRVNSALESERDVLQSSLDRSDLLVEVKDKAVVKIRSKLDQVLLEKSDLEYAVTFYENLIVSASDKSSLEMFEFKAYATEAEDVYEFSILLGQDVRRAKTISGEVDLLVIGADADMEPVEFTTNNAVMGFPLTYEFKYFQDLAGKIRLPADFNPARAAIVIRSSGGRPLLETELDWILES